MKEQWDEKRRLALVRERGVCFDDLDRLATVMLRRRKQQLGQDREQERQEKAS